MGCNEYIISTAGFVIQIRLPVVVKKQQQMFIGGMRLSHTGYGMRSVMSEELYKK